jgi:hypothetical protein
MTFPTVIGQAAYGATDLAQIPNIIGIDTLFLFDSGRPFELEKYEADEFEWLQSTSTGNGRPCAYTYIDSQILLWPTPVAVYTMRPHMHYKLTELSADTDTNAWTNDAEQLIRCHAKLLLYANLIEDTDGMQRMSAQIQSLQGPPRLQDIGPHGDRAHPRDELLMPVIPFGEYRPDLSDYEAQTEKGVLNVVPRGDGYGPFPSLAAISLSLGAQCRGAFAAYKTDGSVVVFAATSTDLYQLNNTTYGWTKVSLGGGPYAAVPASDQWSFAQFNNLVIAVQANVAPQVFDISSSTAFANLAGSPPQARYVDVVGRFVVLTGLLTNATGCSGRA